MGLHYVPKLGSRAQELTVRLVLIASFAALLFLSPSFHLLVSLMLACYTNQRRSRVPSSPSLPLPLWIDKGVGVQSWVSSDVWIPPHRFIPQTYAFIFPNIADWLLTCVKLHLWFYNAALRLMLSSSWKTWSEVINWRVPGRKSWGELVQVIEHPVSTMAVKQLPVEARGASIVSEE